MLSSRAWELVLEYLKEQEEDLKAGIISPYNEDMSKSIFNKRDMLIKELSDLKEFEKVPERLLTRISNKSDILE